MRIGIEANGVFGWRGPSRNISNIVRVLPQLAPEHQFFLFASRPLDGHAPQLSNVTCVRVPSRKPVPWMSVSLPLAATKHKLDIVLFPQYNFWLWKPMRTVVIMRTSTIGPWTPSKIDHIHARARRLAARRVADRVVVCTEFNADQVADYLLIPREEIEVVPNCVDPAFLDPKVSPRTDLGEYILYVGGTEHRKNLTRLLRSYSILVKRGCRQRLIMVGGKFGPTEPPLAAVQQAVSELGLDGRLVFAGVVTDAEELAGFYRGARIVVFPSLWEEFGMIAIEAMACGCPVVASNVSAIPEVVGDAGLLFDPYDVNDIADKMEQVLTDDDLRNELIARGHERVKHFRWEESGRKLLKILEEVGG